MHVWHVHLYFLLISTSDHLCVCVCVHVDEVWNIKYWDFDHQGKT